MRTSSGPLTLENAINDLTCIMRECPGGNLGEIIDAAIDRLKPSDRAAVVQALFHWAERALPRKNLVQAAGAELIEGLKRLDRLDDQGGKP